MWAAVFEACLYCQDSFISLRHNPCQHVKSFLNQAAGVPRTDLELVNVGWNVCGSSAFFSGLLGSSCFRLPRCFEILRTISDAKNAGCLIAALSSRVGRILFVAFLAWLVHETWHGRYSVGSRMMRGGFLLLQFFPDWQQGTVAFPSCHRRSGLGTTAHVKPIFDPPP